MQQMGIYVVALVVAGFISGGNACSLSLLSSKPDYSHQKAKTVEKVEVHLEIVKTLSDQLELEGVVKNVGSESVFIMTHPTRADGSKGPYISLADQDPGTMEIAIKLFAPPRYFLAANATGVQLEKLAPGNTHRETFYVSFPLSETLPPYGEKLSRRQIDGNGIHSIRLSVGVLPDDAGIRDLLERKPFGPFLNGSELLMKGNYQGKRTLDLESVHSSESVRRL